MNTLVDNISAGNQRSQRTRILAETNGGTVSTDTISQAYFQIWNLIATTVPQRALLNNVSATDFPKLFWQDGGLKNKQKTPAVSHVEFGGTGEEELLTRLLSPGSSFFSSPLIFGVVNEGYSVFIGQPHDYSDRIPSQPHIDFGVKERGSC